MLSFFLLAVTLSIFPNLTPPVPEPPAKEQVCIVTKTGVTATWYQIDGTKVAWSYHGRPGTRMYPGCMTAAHRTLPFGTKLKVMFRDKEVMVTVTDRGPEEWTGADLDLSKEAAIQLGMLRLGRVEVTTERKCTFE